LGRFSDVLSVLATATRALSNTQEDSEPSPDHDIGEDITTLEHGLAALRAVYDEFDVGLRELRS
jgi:Zn-dependent metalloprotease